MSDDKCPKCKESLMYHGSDLEGESLAYEVECPKCGWTGYEVHKLVFSHYENRAV